jgi:hypothetical protein
VVAAGTAALALAGPFALRPFVDVAGAAGDVTMAFVLDFGGPHSNQVAGCVTVPGSDNGYEALAAFAGQEHLALPTYNAVNLLCSINGIPATGCGQALPHGFIYWSYFVTDNGSWSYANSGAFASVSQDEELGDDVQGWRFQDPGKGNPDDPPPRTAPIFADLCPSSTTTTTTATTTTVPSHVHPVPSAGTAHRTKDTASTTTTTPGLSLAAPSGSTGSGPTATTSTDPSDTSTSLPQTSIPPDPEVGVISANRSSDQGGAGPGPDPLIVGGLLVAVLAIAAYTRWRKRPRTP